MNSVGSNNANMVERRDMRSGEEVNRVDRVSSKLIMRG